MIYCCSGKYLNVHQNVGNYINSPTITYGLVSLSIGHFYCFPIHTQIGCIVFMSAIFHTLTELIFA